jgi:hypothetical protein
MTKNAQCHAHAKDFYHDTTHAKKAVSIIKPNPEFARLAGPIEA